MHVLLFGKACMQLSFMHGCENRLENLGVADEEPEFQNVNVGVPTELEYMHAGMLSRAVDVDWTLASDTLPPLPRGFHRRSLLFLRPSIDYSAVTNSSRALSAGTSRTVFGGPGLDAYRLQNGLRHNGLSQNGNGSTIMLEYYNITIL